MNVNNYTPRPIRVANTFPTGTPMIQLGSATSIGTVFPCPSVSGGRVCTGMSVENLVLDGNGQSINSIPNTNSQDLSAVNQVSLYRGIGTIAAFGNTPVRMHENRNVRDMLPQSATPLAAKRRKNAAHGASRGEECKTDQPHRGERLVATLSRSPGMNLT